MNKACVLLKEDNILQVLDKISSFSNYECIPFSDPKTRKDTINEIHRLASKAKEMVITGHVQWDAGNPYTRTVKNEHSRRKKQHGLLHL